MCCIPKHVGLFYNCIYQEHQLHIQVQIRWKSNLDNYSLNKKLLLYFSVSNLLYLFSLTTLWNSDSNSGMLPTYTIPAVKILYFHTLHCGLEILKLWFSMLSFSFHNKIEELAVTFQLITLSVIITLQNTFSSYPWDAWIVARSRKCEAASLILLANPLLQESSDSDSPVLVFCFFSFLISLIVLCFVSVRSLDKSASKPEMRMWKTSLLQTGSVTT